MNQARALKLHLASDLLQRQNLGLLKAATLLTSRSELRKVLF